MLRLWLALWLYAFFRRPAFPAEEPTSLDGDAGKPENEVNDLAEGMVNDKVVDAVTMEEVKTIAGAPASSAANLHQSISLALSTIATDMAQASARRNNIADQAMGLVLKNMIEVDPNEAFSLAKQFTSNDAATQLAQLLTALNSGAQGVKSAGNTPPTTP